MTPETPLRILHEGFAGLRIVDDHDRFVLVDPHDDAGWTDPKGRHAAAIVLSGGPWAERYAGAAAIAGDARRPWVIGAPAALDWLAKAGEITPKATPATVERFEVSATAYAPRQPRGARRDRVAAALKRPRWAARRWMARAGLPDAPPAMLRLRVADDHDFAHLGLALHGDQGSAFVAKARAFCEGADFVLAALPRGDEDAFVAQVLAIAPPRLVLIDQTGDVRRAAGLSGDLLTPVRDRLVAEGLETHVLVAGTSIRFEQDDTIKAW